MFLTPLILKADPRPELWVIDAPLVWCDATYGRISVPVGFRTDLASTPFHIDDNGPSRRPAAVHDALYKLGRSKGKDWADAFIAAAILAEGGGHMRSWTYYHGVHWFGGPSWASDSVPATPTDFDTPGNWAAWKLNPTLFA